MLKKTLLGWLISLTLLVPATYLTYAAGPPTPPPISPQHDSDSAPVAFSIIVYSDGTWEGEAHFAPLSSAPSSLGLEAALDAQVQREAAAIFRGHGIRYSLDEKKDVNYTFSLKGEYASEIVEMALSAGHVVKRLDGPVALYLGGFVRESQPLTLTLSANPSTGYSWDVEALDGSTISQSNDVETHHISEGLGVLTRQVIRLAAMETGQVNLRLVYRRPWQADLSPTVVISIQPDGLDLAAACSTLSMPLPPPVSTHTFESLKGLLGQASQWSTAPSSAQGLPSAYNWCDEHGGCTPIKDQGQCGSCWAFATVGPLEAHLQAAGQMTDLSEQYLVSCNIESPKYGCDGGWFAHDYHLNEIPPNETQAGAVLESAFPYVASDVPCSGPYNHPYRIASWHYVGSWSGIPSVDAIKQAIYDHGPVAAAICAGNEFQDYDGGVFQTDETCDYTINHAIVLVGWNDSEQAWILRNSWGTGWGESGYMRIQYGVSQVGYAANYVIYNIPLVASDWVYLPLVARSFGATPTLSNGDFEGGRDGSWSEYSSNGWGLILQSSDLPSYVSPHGGNWATWLGGDDDETSTLSQQATIPSDATTLNYWYWIDSEDWCGYDYAYVRFGSTTLKTDSLCESNNTGGWKFQQINITSWQGQTVELRFVVETDGSLNSNFFLDDVSLSTTTASPGLPISPDTPEASAGHTTATKESR
ncbi:MAG: C1 family peptidase [Anaerolineae bacterium]